MMQDNSSSKDYSLTEVRLNKFISDAGVCSRRQADLLIEQGRVRVDGNRACTGMKILPAQEIMVDGKIINRVKPRVIVAVYKPVGVICTSEKRKGTVNIDDFTAKLRKQDKNFPDDRMVSVGRLDKDSEGLLLLTNNGDIVNDILRARNGHEKEYKVTLNKEVTEALVSRLSGGIEITIGEADKARTQKTRPCKVWKIGKYTIGIILTQGLNRQIRKMCEVCGYKVTALKRVRIMNIELGKLGPGEWRFVEGDELAQLFEMIAGKSEEL